MKSSDSPAPVDSRAYRVAHRVFLIGLALKGLNAFVELVVGGLLLAVPFDTVRAWVAAWVGWAEHFTPAGWSPRLDALLGAVAPAGVAFVAWYFLSHGVLKAFVIACLFWGKRWAYPLGIVIFVAFGVYQTWEYFRTGGVFYLALDVLDFALIVLTAMEWRHALHAAPAVDKASPLPPS